MSAVLPGVDLWSEAARAGLGIARVHVVGHRFTPDAAIFQALGLDDTVTQLSFDGASARTRLEQLPWVAAATVQRVFPDGLTVAVAEREPYAIWRLPGRDLLVDATGRELGAVGSGSDVGLPVVAGVGAGPKATEVLALIAGYESIARRFAVAHRIADRRWRLELVSGARIELPAEGAAAAIDRLVARVSTQQLAGLLDGRLDSIDLRHGEHIVIRRRIDNSRQPDALSRHRSPSPVPGPAAAKSG